MKVYWKACCRSALGAYWRAKTDGTVSVNLTYDQIVKQESKTRRYNSVKSSAEKRWRLCILPKYHASLTQLVKYKESHIFARFVPLQTTLCMLGLKVLDLFFAFL